MKKKIFIIIEFLFEVFTVCKEVKQFECFLFYLFRFNFFKFRFPFRIDQLGCEIMCACTSSLNLYKICWREDRSHQADIQDVCAVIACRHHADCHTYTGLARFVAIHEISRPAQVVVLVAEIDRELLCITD